MLTPREELKDIETYKIASYPECWDMKLDSNENYIGPSTNVMRVLKELSVDDVSHYPCYGLFYELLSEKNQIDSSDIVITNGADEALSAVLNTYISKGDTVLTVTPSFTMPKIYSQIIGAQYIEIPYEKKWEYPFEKVKEALTKGVKALLITTPNNPTGDVVSQEQIEEILKNNPDLLVIIDETYANYCSKSNIGLVEKYDNAVVVKSLSKDYALAGLRLGYIVSQEENINNIKKVLSPYNVNAAAVVAGTAAISDEEYLSYVVNEITAAKVYLTSEFEKFGALVYPSGANFLLVDFGFRSELIFNILKANKIIVKSFKGNNDLKNCIRITVPTMSAASRIVSIIKSKITLVFDMDGVMIDVSRSYYEAIKHTYNHFTGKNLSDDQICDARKLGGLNNDWDLTEYLIKQSGFDFPYEKIVEVFQNHYWNDGQGSINEETLLIDDKLLAELSQKYNTAVFTGRPKQEALYTLSKFGIKQYFQKIVTMDDLPLNMQKPDTAGLMMIKNSFITDYLVYFGDTVDDAKCASNFVGTYGVGVLPPTDKSDELKNLLLKTGAKAVINDINELNTVLENINNENEQNCAQN